MSDSNYTFDFSMLQSAAASFVSGGDAIPSATTMAAAPAAAASAAAAGAAPASDSASGAPSDLAAGLAASPFGPLIGVGGITAESLAASLSQNNNAGALASLGTAAGNPFASLTGSGDPFPAGTANPFENYVGANNPFASSSNPFASANPSGA